VLRDDQGQPGASNRPPDTAAASNHGGTAPTSGQRDPTAADAPATAATASANTDPIAAGGTGSTPTRTSSAVNTNRTASARPAKQRSHPRTVSTGRPTTAAIARTPAPAAFAASAAPITVTASARRSSANTGSRTCDPPHDRHRVRRGRTTGPPRTTRTRAQPHGRNSPPHPGHLSPPFTSRSSTRAASTPTVSTAPPCATRPSRTRSAKETPGGPSHALIGTVPPPTNTAPHRHAPRSVGTHNAPNPPRMSASTEPFNTQTLPNGYCGLPVQKSCPHANACLTCPVFLTGPQFLPELREQRHRTLTLIEVSREKGHDRVVEMNQQVLNNLDRMISEVEKDEQEDPADAG
jgi:hypothetical protein